eukprot:tig00000076_g2339.t1
MDTLQDPSAYGQAHGTRRHSTNTNSGGPYGVEIVKLNLRGRIFVTTRDTLLAGGSTFFSGLLSGRFRSPVWIDGAIFIDRDPENFERLLNFLTTKYLEVPRDTGALRRLLADADYYCLPIRDGLRRCGRCRTIYLAEGDPLPECACELHPGEYRQGPLEHTGSSMIRCLGEDYDTNVVMPATSNHCLEMSRGKAATQGLFCERCAHGESRGTGMAWREHRREHAFQWAWSCCGDRRHDAPPCAAGPHVPGPLAPPPPEPHHV